jgi:hypothetical protein
MIAIVTTMASFLQPAQVSIFFFSGAVDTCTDFFVTHQSKVKLDTLLPQWGTLPSEVGVLFRSKAYLQDQNASTRKYSAL